MASGHLVYAHGVPRMVSVNKEVSSLIGAKPAVTPSTLVFDHGRENDGMRVPIAAAEAGIDLVYCPPGAAYAKGIVESWHNALREAQSLLEAFKGANALNHPKGVEDMATLTAEDLHDALWDYVLHVYHQKPHDGLRASYGRSMTPAEAYRTHLESGGHIELLDDPMRVMNFMSTKQCLLQEYGLNVNSRTYNSAELRDLRGLVQKGVGAPARQLKIYYDRYDVSRVYLRHPRTRAWMCVPQTGAGVGIAVPYSELLDQALNHSVLKSDRRPLTKDELQLAAARFHNRWGPDGISDRRIAQITAIERSRALSYAHDLGDLTQEFRDLAFGAQVAQEGVLGDAAREADDDPCDAVEEDEEFDWEIDDGLAL